MYEECKHKVAPQVESQGYFLRMACVGVLMPLHTHWSIAVEIRLSYFNQSPAFSTQYLDLSVLRNPSVLKESPPFFQ